MKKFSSSEKYTPKGIVLVPSYNCNAKCMHCNNDAEKHDLSLKMDINKAIEIIREAKDYGLNSLQITGGEITMYPEFIPPVISAARQMAVRVNKPPTNCYIASRPKEANLFFRKLKQTGYTGGFRVSIDPYHQAYVPLHTAADFISIYSSYFKVSSLTIGSCYYDAKRIFSMYDELGTLLKKRGFRNFSVDKSKKSIYADGQRIKYGMWMPTRPSRKPLKDEEVLLKKIDRTKPCLGSEGLAYLWIEPDFKVRVCSGNGNGFLDCYVAGDLKKETIEQTVAGIRRSRIFNILAGYGPAGLRDALKEKGITMDYDKKYSFMCELCNEITGKKEFRELLEKE
ncbi:MAG: radical SAM protein [Candidatus Goldiibacteriota bacterium]